MSLSIKIIFLLIKLFYFNTVKYKYILIFTPRNCAPCIVTADDFFYNNKIDYLAIKLYENKADKYFTNQTVLDFCKNSKAKSSRCIKDKFKFGSYNFTANDNGPFLIKYSSSDTIVFNSLNIEEVNH